MVREKVVAVYQPRLRQVASTGIHKTCPASRRFSVTLKKVSRMVSMSGPEEEEAGGKDLVAEFITTGRVGRRNALADILTENTLVSVSDLPDKLRTLTVKEGEDKESTLSASEDDGSQPSTSKASS